MRQHSFLETNHSMGKTRQGYCPIVKGQENSEKERTHVHVLTEFYMFFVQQ